MLFFHDVMFLYCGSTSRASSKNLPSPLINWLAGSPHRLYVSGMPFAPNSVLFVICTAACCDDAEPRSVLYMPCHDISRYSHGSVITSYIGSKRIFAPAFTSTSILPCSPEVPFFVVINITPFAPRLPYSEVAVASFRMVVLAMSPGSIDEMSPS